MPTRLYPRSLIFSCFFLLSVSLLIFRLDVQRHNWRHRKQTRPCHFPQSSLNFHELDEIEPCWFRDQKEKNFWRNFSDCLSQLHLRMLMSSSSSKARAREKWERELRVPQTNLNLSQCQLFLSIWINFAFSPTLVESNENSEEHCIIPLSTSVSIKNYANALWVKFAKDV